MLCALIMAGGKGTRFWPMSTEEKPKQFLTLLGEDSMIKMTVKRLLTIIPMERIFIATGTQYVDLVKQELPDLNENNIIVEPEGRNTAPCIALSAFYIKKRFKDSTMLVLPSDHLIGQEGKFLDTINLGYETLREKPQGIITIGITPTRPETAYGYIEYKSDNSKVLKVSRFVEKPDLEKALKYISKGNYLWNSGMFMWKTDNILNLINKHLKGTYQVLSEVAVADVEDYDKVLNQRYKEVDSISIDFGVMEKADEIYVIPGNFGWDDIGSWQSLERYRPKDEKNNITSKNVKIIDGDNNLILSSGKQLVVCGLSDIYLVESENIIVLGKKEELDKIRNLKFEIENC
ncbi:MAG: mannose-1-phosphate guanylyltransferase [Clostridium sp.]